MAAGHRVNHNFKFGGNFVDNQIALWYSKAVIDNLRKMIEVAFSKSTFSDMADIEEGKEKGRTPKEAVFCRRFLGHMPKRYMTVIRH